VILDNLSTHTTPKVHRWLLRQRRFPSALHPHPWVVGEPGRTLVRRADHQEAAALRPHQRAALTADTQAWVDAWNDDPKPFVWHKTADEILDRLAGYCRAVTHGA